MDEDIPGRQLVTVAGQAADPSPEAAGSALMTPEMRLELMAARLDGLAAQNRRLAHDNDDLRQENRRLLASASQLRGENLALSRALVPARAATEELGVLAREVEDLRQAMQADRAARTEAAERARADIAALAEAAAERAADRFAGCDATLSAATVDRLADALTRQARDSRYEDAASMLAAMQRSTSWRVTKPIRAAGRVFKK